MQVRPIDLPRKLTLPSGLLVSFGRRTLEPQAPPAKGEPLFADVIQALASVELASGGQPVDVHALPLGDFHVLRAVLGRAGLVHEDDVTVSCSNCDAALTLRPCAGFEWGPYVEGTLGDPELDHTEPLGVDVPIEPTDLGDGLVVDVLRLEPRTVAEAMPLFRALAAPQLHVTGAFVRALGLATLGPLRGPRRIARALASCSDEAFARITSLFHDAHYAPRLFSWWRCEACGARNDVDAPMLREFTVGDLRGTEAGASAGAFMTEDEFAALGASTFASLRPDPRVQLVVDAGVPACDDGGEPLLGSYVPGTPEGSLGLVLPPTVTLYYRTFRAVWGEDESFDVPLEVRETLEHELEHHGYALEGHDPMDEDEHEVIDREVSRVVGEQELLRRGTLALLRDLGGFVQRTWWMWLVLLALVALVASR